MRRIVIGIAGGTGSGKSTITKRLLEMTGYDKAIYLKQDDYYKDQGHLNLEQREKTNYDQPEAFDVELLVDHLKKLKEGKAVEVPQYDFEKHTRKPHGIKLDPREIIIIEGTLILAIESIRDLIDIRIYVDTDCDVRILRRIKRDMMERGRSLDSVIDQYYATVKPAHIFYVEPSKRFADIIMPEGGNNEIALGLVQSKINSIIKDNEKSY